MNRLSMENLTEPITKDLDFQLQDPFLLYRNARLVIHGIWFYDKEDCQRIAQRMKILTQLEQALVQSPGGGRDAQGVDIIQMLNKARTEYDKSTTEPKEIGGSSVLCGNPNLVKPIPVKPHNKDNEGHEHKPLSLAALFGSQHQLQHHPPPKADPVPPVMVSSADKTARPPVARTLTYDDAPNRRGGKDAPAASSDEARRALVKEDGGTVGAGLLLSPTTAQQTPQPCAAIAKLMQGQRSAGGAAGMMLQTLSESPENRLCDNGVTLDHHQHLLHHLHHQQQHHHHLQQQQQQQHHQQQLHSDPIKRLFQTHHPPPPPSNIPVSPTATSCCPKAPPPPLPLPVQQNPYLPSQPAAVDSGSCAPHMQGQSSQPLFFSVPKCDPQLSSQIMSAAQGIGLPVPGVLSPHELLQKLQLVQQEQSMAAHEAPRLCPGLAPRFLGASQNQAPGTVPNLPTVGQKAGPQFQVISPQKIPATVAPTLLLSPNVFTQRSSSETQSHPLPLQPEVHVLSRSQLQASLLHLIQTDSSFLDTLYEAYISRFANKSHSKY
ncbi:mRNA-decapping enzyme 1B isoform X1 [Gouania willdenowi]|nr:mRNA-decapping enzyme 1B-like isoform X1 [Gouania willdenowi]